MTTDLVYLHKCPSVSTDFSVRETGLSSAARKIVLLVYALCPYSKTASIALLGLLVKPFKVCIRPTSIMALTLAKSNLLQVP